MYSFGRNDYGQLGVGSTHNHYKPVALRVGALERPLGRLIGIAGGCYHTLVLDVNGRVAAFGRNNHGQPSDAMRRMSVTDHRHRWQPSVTV